MKCVYKISCVDNAVEEFYIGSTIDLEERIISHKTRYNNNSNYKIYKFIREHGGLSNWEINPIEIYECEMTKLELKQQEQFYLDEYKPQLNSLRALAITKNEYNEKRKEKAKCPICNNEMRKDSVLRHIRRKHPTSTQ